MVDRLQRLTWVFSRSPVYFVTACAEQRKPILANERAHEAILRFAENGTSLGAWLGAFVLMPDHLHAFVAIEGSALNGHSPLSLGDWMKSLKRTISQSLSRSDISAPHWQKGFFDHVLRSEESYTEKWSYVRANPVRAGLVAHESDWPYFAEPFPLQYRNED